VEREQGVPSPIAYYMKIHVFYAKGNRGAKGEKL